MRKTMMPPPAGDVAAAGQWMDLERIARAELTSEDPGHPLENALTSGTGGWRASASGEQTIRLVFDDVVHVRRLRLVFEEPERERTQQVTVRWHGAATASGEVVRQQYTFSPQGATRQEETWDVDLPGVRTLELLIVPDVSRGAAVASLAELRVG